MTPRFMAAPTDLQNKGGMLGGPVRGPPEFKGKMSGFSTTWPTKCCSDISHIRNMLLLVPVDMGP